MNGPLAYRKVVDSSVSQLEALTIPDVYNIFL